MPRYSAAVQIPSKAQSNKCACSQTSVIKGENTEYKLNGLNQWLILQRLPYRETERKSFPKHKYFNHSPIQSLLYKYKNSPSAASQVQRSRKTAVFPNNSLRETARPPNTWTPTNDRPNPGGLSKIPVSAGI